MDALEVCRRLRSSRCRTPVLMLPRASRSSNRFTGLDAEGDDYTLKPFSIELSARLRALARRGDTAHDPVLSVGSLRLDPAAHRVWRGDNGTITVGNRPHGGAYAQVTPPRHHQGPAPPTGPASLTPPSRPEPSTIDKSHPTPSRERSR